MQVIRQTGAGTVHASTGYTLRGAILFAGTNAKITDGAGRDVFGIPAVGGIMLPSALQIAGLITTGTFTDLYIYVE